LLVVKLKLVIEFN